MQNILKLKFILELMSSEKEDHDLKDMRIPMDSDLLEKVEKIMEYYGIKNKTEIIRVLITLEYRKIKKELENQSD